MLTITLVLLAMLVQTARAQDPRDAEIFGSSVTPSASEAVTSPTSASASSSPLLASPSQSSLIDSLQIGGRLELYGSTGKRESTPIGRSQLTQRRQADIYFDSRPNKDLRAFLRTRFVESTPATKPDDQGLQQQLDELWLKWDIDDRIFVTVGKQQLKWGSGRFWNPTDFTATETLDPLELVDRRLGRSLIKFHLPMEKQAFNFYAILQLEEASRNQDIGGALRAELALFGSAEIALTLQTRADKAQRAGFDLSTALGPVDGYIETAVSRRESQIFYEGEFAPTRGQTPVAKQDRHKTFTQIVTGLRKQWKYTDADLVTTGVEVFVNELGYDDPELELFAIATRQTRPLQAGRHYAGIYLLAPAPWTWNDTAFYANALKNFTDKTSVVRLTMAWTLFKEASLEAYISQCQGDYGELCFRVPQIYAADGLPTSRTLTSFGSGIRVNF